ncbi:MAG: pantetheine-phosphate adenylyltransferase [Spirochaetaceae bacterium]|jgi:pantetheine-phosphate adenylyltransferase|nr:pantetheine-phosphate adenylyltransferase [Spirochaetaceae bacterium]
MIKAVFPGSFDPPTFGHLDIIKRAAALFNNLTVLVAHNTNKNCLFTVPERIELLSKMILELRHQYSNIYIDSCDTLVVDYMQKQDIKVLIRGARNVNDFIKENDLSYWNHHIDGNIETVILFPRPEYAHFSSSAARELLIFGKDAEALLPPVVYSAVLSKMRTNI